MTPVEFEQARQSLGLDAVQAARMLGYGSRTRISEIEHGTRNPGAAVVRLMRAYLAGYRPDDWRVGTEVVGLRRTEGLITPFVKVAQNRDTC